MISPRPSPEQVEATKFTEVGFHGRDVDQIIRDLVDNAISLQRQKVGLPSWGLCRELYHTVNIISIKIDCWNLISGQNSDRQGSGKGCRKPDFGHPDRRTTSHRGELLDGMKYVWMP